MIGRGDEAQAFERNAAKWRRAKMPLYAVQNNYKCGEYKYAILIDAANKWKGEYVV